jgi:hypothetical protein
MTMNWARHTAASNALVERGVLAFTPFSTGWRALT